MRETIDLSRQVASLHPEPADAREMYERMESSMHHCTDAFEKGNVQELEECFDPDIVLYSPDGEYHGRQQAVAYLEQRFMKYAPDLCYKMTLQDVKTYGDALWYSYEYEIDTPVDHIVGHGMSMCRKVQGKWLVLNLHNSVPRADAAAPSGAED
jgi:hypothetical protein